MLCHNSIEECHCEAIVDGRGNLKYSMGVTLKRGPSATPYSDWG
jgi:hypothetical protein